MLASVAALFAGFQAPSPELAEGAFPGANGKIAFTASFGGGTTEIHVVNADGSGEEPLIADAQKPAWSPDGRSLAFIRVESADGSRDVWVADADGGNQRQITTTGDARTPTWSPDGTQIAFTRDGGIAIADVESGAVSQLTTQDGSPDQAPEWSPDGTRIAFSGGRGSPPGEPILRVWLVTLDGALTQLTDGPFDIGATWSPDGNEVAFIREQSAPKGIAAVNVNDGSVRSIVSSGGSVGANLLSWSPEGDQIALARHADPLQIFTADTDGSGGVQQLTTGPAMVKVDPDWQPLPRVIAGVEFTQGIQELQTISGLQSSLGSGSAQLSAFPGENGKIAFWSGQDGDPAIGTINPDGSEETELIPGARDPAWSPDGSMLTFSKRVGSTPVSDIWVADADGSNQRQVISDGSISRHPSWSPDGSQIVYERSPVGGPRRIWVVGADGSNARELFDGVS